MAVMDKESILSTMHRQIQDLHEAIFNRPQPLPIKLSKKQRLKADLEQRKEQERIRIISRIKNS